MAESDVDTAKARGDAIVLPDRLDIGAAQRLREACLAAPADIAIDAGAVTVATTPALQVLMAARDHQRARGQALRFVRVSPGFAACAATLGVPLARMQTPGGAA